MKPLFLNSTLFPQVIFQATGGNTHFFLSDCLSHRIRVSDVSSSEYGLRARVKAKDYLRLHRSARRAGCHLNIEKKCGIWFSLYKLRRHKGAAMGAILSVVLLLLTGSLVWNVEYYGVSSDAQQELGNLLFTYGVYQGCFATDEKMRAAETAVLARTPQYADISLNYAKGKLIVEVQKATSEPQMLLPQDWDITASETGVIRQVEVFSGTSDIRPGQLVQKGDVLVRAVWPDQENRPQPSPCRARIMAYIENTCATALRLKQTRSVITGTQTDSLALCFGGKRFYLKKGEAPDAVPSCQGVQVLGFALPVTVYKTIQTQTVQEEYVLTETQAKQKCVETLNALLYAEHPEMEVLSREYSFENIEDTVYCTLQLRAYVDIAASPMNEK
ncbi:MAG: sporulation protein YqfD [Oscillospiraceae bacterium]|nr:sporulation protein YqfD [Oscillospiraceae bacterium]